MFIGHFTPEGEPHDNGIIGSGLCFFDIHMGNGFRNIIGDHGTDKFLGGFRLGIGEQINN